MSHCVTRATLARRCVRDPAAMGVPDGASSGSGGGGVGSRANGRTSARLPAGHSVLEGACARLCVVCKEPTPVQVLQRHGLTPRRSKWQVELLGMPRQSGDECHRLNQLALTACLNALHAEQHSAVELM